MIETRCCYKRIMEVNLCNHKRDQSTELQSNTLVSSLEISVERLSGRLECYASLFSKHIPIPLCLSG